MSVYVDSMKAQFGRLVLCHMIADTSEELHAMAERIGLKRVWCQYEGTYREHYDVGRVKRALAIKEGALEITRTELGGVLHRRRTAAAGAER